MPSTRIPLLLGTGEIGLAGESTDGMDPTKSTVARITDTAEVQKWVDVMVEHGQPYVDTARIYGRGTSEKLLSRLDLKGARVDTKAYPQYPGDHSAAKLKQTLRQSLDALGPNIKVRVFYLHAPDRTVPFEETAEAVNDLHKQGLFEEFGLSNFMAFEVAEIVGICKRRGFVQPTVYQGRYNLIYRVAEAELFPCLRKFGIKFAAFSVLGGGLLTGKLLDNARPAPGSHWDPNGNFGTLYAAHFGHGAEAIRDLRTVAKKYGLPLTDVAYRWLQHHSEMIPDDHGVVIGGSNVGQIEKAIVESEKGPLPEEVVAACEETWNKVKGAAPQRYWA